MNILFVGDVVGDLGRKMLRDNLPRLKKDLEIDLCIVNGENSSQGNSPSRLPASLHRRKSVHFLLSEAP